MMTNILVVDDHENIRNLIEIYLKREGYSVLLAADGQEALDILEEHSVDLMIADVMMPNIDGFELVDTLRASGYDLPILVLTAKDTLKDKREGFGLGADDYMVKPVDMEEMMLRVSALLRRAKINTEQSLRINSLILDYASLEVRSKEDTLFLPMKEFYLLYKLLSYPNRIFTRQELIDDIWGYDSDVDYRTVDVHIKRLRDHFRNSDDFEIVTIRGLGYKGVIK